MADTLTSSPPHARRRWPLVVLAIGLLAFIWFGGDLAYVAVGAENDHAVPADVIIVLGCNIVGENGPSPCIRARAGHAADLYKQGLAPRVIATGGPVENGPTEAAVLAYVLEADGVPSDAIVQEGRALNTIQNITYSQQIMREQGWSTAILVTEPFHINRAALIARDAGMQVYPSPATDSANWQSFSAKAYHVGRDTLSLMLYQVKSLLGQRN
ncbi:MAG: YdcF family protein [Chloroflexota bacterium]